MQTALTALGYDCGKVDGIFGKNTEKGVRAFQTASKIEVDGVSANSSRQLWMPSGKLLRRLWRKNPPLRSSNPWTRPFPSTQFTDLSLTFLPIR